VSNWKPDELDRKIMDILQQNGRIDVTRIAKKVNKTPHPIHDRIFRLEEEGYIKGYVALLDRAKIGKPVLVVTMVKLESQTKALVDEFEQAVAVLPEVQSCLLVTGNWNFLLQVSAATPQEYSVFLMEKICAMRNVKYTESLFTLKECKANGPFMFEK
jgi:Lrp/AsnC family leucine-responsive transcriptional regulator